MALLSKKEFAAACGIKTNTLSVQIMRGKVICENELIDSNNEKNKFFLEKQSSRKQEPVEKQEKTSIEIVKQSIIPDNTPLKDVESNEGQSYTESERQLKYLDTLKRRKEIEKLEIDIQKKRGEVVPSELIKPVFLQHNQSIITEFKNATDEVIRIFSKKKSLTINEVAEIKGELIQSINVAIGKATLASVKGVESIILNHSEKRGVGERN